MSSYRIPCLVIFLVVLCSCRNKTTSLFQQLPATETNIHFQNEPASRDSLNFLDYLYYYNGGGVALGDINNDGLQDIYFAANNRSGNKLYLNKGGFKFEDITSAARVAGTADWSTGVTMADVDGDGWTDIYVCVVSGKLGLQGKNQLFINDHRGGFTERAAEFGLDFSGYSTQAAFFDYDHDGDLDCYLLNQSSHSVEMYGDTSLRKGFSPLSGDRFFRNELNKQSNHFTDITNAAGIYSSQLGYGLGIAIGDINNDGWDDVYVGNDFHENDYYYVNNGNGTFTESGASHFGHYSRFSMGNDIADYDNDGQLDIVTLDMLPGDEKYLKTYSGGDALDIYKYTVERNGFQPQFSRNSLQHNLGNGRAFSELGLFAGIAATDWSWSPLLADFDNDGRKDLFISNGIVKRPVDLDYMKYISSTFVQKTMQHRSDLDKQALAHMPDGIMHNYFYKGEEDGRFSDKSSEWGMDKPGYSNGAAYADLDNDGQLDLVVNNIGAVAGIYRNNGAGNNHYLQLSFQGKAANKQGIGVKAYLFQGKKIQYQQLELSRGFQSSSPPILHFGLQDITMVDSLLIVWPDQTQQLLKNINASQRLLLKQSEATGLFQYTTYFPPANMLMTDITGTTGINWRHRENAFIDFDVQRLIPHELSTRGPRLATADVNGDGLDDIYACGAAGQPGQLFIQEMNGRFTVSNIPDFLADKAAEDNDALFFDADGDGDPDLYVVSGGNEYRSATALLADRLYLNDGKGYFSRSKDALPAILTNKSSVAAADIDKDGDMDLFVSGLADAVAYGTPQDSYLLLNNGKGQFNLATEKVFSGRAMGILTAAQFADIDKDGWPDLVVAGEWMPVEVYLNKRGVFERQDQRLPQGLWQSLAIADMDGDGDMDILAGNYGLNSKLRASDKAPLRLYVKDFDRNGQPEPLLTYMQDNKEYTFLGKDELETQLPSMKKTFLRYQDFAGKTVQEVFGQQLEEARMLKVETLQTGVFLNNGKGNFSFEPFNNELQLTPVFSLLPDDINGDGKEDILAAGNFYGVTPYEGRYDANWGTLMIGTGKGGFTTVSATSSGFFARGEVRDIKKIKTPAGYSYVLARNNDSLLFFKAVQ